MSSRIAIIVVVSFCSGCAPETKFATGEDGSLYLLRGEEIFRLDGEEMTPVRVIAPTSSVTPGMRSFADSVSGMAIRYEAQEPSLLRDLPPIQVVIDHINVPTFLLSQEAADVLRGRVIQELRAANVPVSDAVEPTTLGRFLYATTFPVERPTLFVSLNMVPDGCAFIANILVRMPVLLSGQTQETTVAAYASQSYAYLTTWTDHSPVLNYLEDFVVLWRTANEA